MGLSMPLDMYPPEVRGTVSQVLMTVFNENMLSESLKLASELRQAGFKVELYMGNKGIGDQIRYALKRGIPYVAIVGPDELEAGQVVLRHLDQKLQQAVDRNSAAGQIRGWMTAEK